jgi:hypothetical protein
LEIVRCCSREENWLERRDGTFQQLRNTSQGAWLVRVFEGKADWSPIAL